MSAIEEFKIGDRVRLVCEVDRSPHFIADKGTTGVVVQVDGELQVLSDTPFFPAGLDLEFFDLNGYPITKGMFVVWWDDDHLFNGDHFEQLENLTREN